MEGDEGEGGGDVLRMPLVLLGVTCLCRMDLNISSVLENRFLPGSSYCPLFSEVKLPLLSIQTGLCCTNFPLKFSTTYF